MADQPTLLMTDPTHYDVPYAINPWMQPTEWAAHPESYRAAARTAAATLARTLAQTGARLEMMDGVPGLPDMVFPANAAVVLDRRALLARFRYPERQGEEPHFLAAFEALRTRGLLDEVVQLPAGCFQEGAGDCIWDRTRGVFWAGHGPRSTPQAADAIGAFFGREVVKLGLASDRFYHLDTCFCPLSGGEILYYPPALTPEAQAAVRAHVPADLLIEASEEDAARFCVNAVSIGSAIVMAEAAPALRRTLGARGYHLREVDLHPFIMSGGAAFCMTLRLDQTSTAGAASRPILSHA
jgi:N-dimethylarginine dimethylaminohydrolase